MLVVSPPTPYPRQVKIHPLFCLEYTGWYVAKYLAVCQSGFQEETDFTLKGDT